MLSHSNVNNHKPWRYYHMYFIVSIMLSSIGSAHLPSTSGLMQRISLYFIEVYMCYILKYALPRKD